MILKTVVFGFIFLVFFFSLMSINQIVSAAIEDPVEEPSSTIESTPITISLSSSSGPPGTDVVVTAEPESFADTVWSFQFRSDIPNSFEHHIYFLEATRVSSSELNFMVPLDVACGKHNVSVFSGHDPQVAEAHSYTVTFDVTGQINGQCILVPQITSLSVDNGKPGAEITVYGTNFHDEVMTVSLGREFPPPYNWVDIPAEFISSTQLRFTLPVAQEADNWCGETNLFVKHLYLRTGSNKEPFNFTCAPRNPSSFSILSWNIKLFPTHWILNPEISGWNPWGGDGSLTPLRVFPIIHSNIINYYPYHDVIVFQEAFSDDHRNTVLDWLEDLYPYRTDILMHEDTGTLEGTQDGGVIILSQWPIMEEKHWQFWCKKDDIKCQNAMPPLEARGNKIVTDRALCFGLLSHGSDCGAKKGVLYAKINKKGQSYHVFGTHLDAGDALFDISVREMQLEQMKKFVDSQKIPIDEPIIMAGDFNIHYDKGKDLREYEMAVNILDVKPITKDPSGPDYTGNQDPVSWLDYIFLTSLPKNSGEEPYNTSHYAFGGPEDGGHISDHNPVDLLFKIPKEGEKNFEPKVKYSSTGTYEEPNGLPDPSLSFPSSDDSIAFSFGGALPENLSPLKQMKTGVAPEDVQCRYGLELIQKPTGGVACVKPSSISKLLDIGWLEIN